MARNTRDELELASARLRAAGHEDSAQAVDAVLAPGGWTLLREKDAPFTANLPLTMRKSLKEALKKAAEHRNVTLTSVVTEGHRKVLDGSWTPPARTRVVRRISGAAAEDPRAVLNVTVEDALRDQLRKRLPALSQELGYTVTEGGIATAYLKTYFEADLARLLPIE